MTRDEHLAWCKQRALEYVDRGELADAVTSMLSDLRKHPETDNHPGGTIGAGMLFVAGWVHDAHQIRKWIEGFN